MPKRPQAPMESVGAGVLSPFLRNQARYFIDPARHRVVGEIDSDLTQPFGDIGRSFSTKLLLRRRGEYGEQVVTALARKLMAEFGKGWIEQNLRRCLRLVEVFASKKSLSKVRTEFSWFYHKTSPGRWTVLRHINLAGGALAVSADGKT